MLREPAAVVALTALVVVARALLAPSHARDGHDDADHERAAGSSPRTASDSIAPFVLRADKAYFFSHGGVLAYRTLRETAVVAGDPVGPPGAAARDPRGLRGVRRAGAAGTSSCWPRATSTSTPTRRSGLRTMQVGLEAVVDPRTLRRRRRPASRPCARPSRRVARRGWTIELVARRAT